MVSRIPFAVWNTVAASPIAADTVPNTSAIVDEREEVVARLRYGSALVLRAQLPASVPDGRLRGLSLRKQRASTEEQRSLDV